MLRVGIVGLGGMGGVHFGEYCKMNHIELAAVADVRVDMASEKVKEKGLSIPVYASLEEMLEKEKLDILDICTPSYLHKEMAIYALEKGVIVLSEKTMVLSPGDGKEIIETAKKCGKKYMVAHVVRFMKPYEYLKKVIDEKKYGKMTHLIMNRISSIPLWSWEDWMRDEERSGHVVIDLSVHDIDFMQSVFGKPKEISSVYHEMRGNSNYIVSNYIYDDFAVSVTGSWYNAKIPFSASYKAIFENGYVYLENGEVIDNGEKVNLDTVDKNDADTGININTADGYGDEILYFIDCVENNKEIERVTPESSLESIRLVEETLKACKKI